MRIPCEVKQSHNRVSTVPRRPVAHAGQIGTDPADDFFWLLFKAEQSSIQSPWRCLSGDFHVAFNQLRVTSAGELCDHSICGTGFAGRLKA